MAERKAEITRDTKETQIKLALNLDGSGQSSVQTPVGFLDHMLELLAKHGLFDLEVQATGDVQIDAHHSVEDIGICFGQAVNQALGDKKGIRRFGQAAVPMDEVLAQVVVDISGRGHCVCNIDVFQGTSFLRESLESTVEAVGKKDLSVAEAVDELIGRSDERELLEEFARALAVNAGMTLHINVPYGKNGHHVVEAVSKALGRALRQAVEADPRQTGVPSTKGVL